MRVFQLVSGRVGSPAYLNSCFIAFLPVTATSAEFLYCLLNITVSMTCWREMRRRTSLSIPVGGNPATNPARRCLSGGLGIGAAMVFIEFTGMKLPQASQPSHAFTLVETAFAAALVAVFFVSLFLINSQCLYFVNCSRELTTASGILQTRMEQLRNCHWSQLTASDGSYIRSSSVLGTAAPGASQLGAMTETINVNSYPTAAGAGITLTRQADGSVPAPSPSPTPNTAVAKADMASITIQLTWTTAPGGRSRSASLSTVWAENTR